MLKKVFSQMVKRKKNGQGALEDEKLDDDGTSCMEISSTTDPVVEPSNSLSSQTNQQKNRIHVTRTSTKEVQSSLSESTDSETNGASTNEKSQKSSPVQRSSNRPQKRLRKDISFTDATGKKPGVTLKQNAPLRSKARRPWELWSVDDKNSFFEALCECGKDFENIQSYIAQKSKKKGVPANMIKNKDQVRHFYYRTWHKISKYLEINDDVRKQTQEIYGLVNYAELRKKIGGCLNEKNRQKLNELVFNGVTTVKYKGKKLRIKTPVCRALKKLNNVAEPKEPEIEKLPRDIFIEFRPHSNQSWLHVQNLAQNPRVRTKVSLQRRLRALIEYLQHKWRPYRLKRKEQVLSSLSQAGNTMLADDPVPILRVKPQSDAQISTLSIATMDNTLSSDVCLEKYMKISRENTLDKETVKVKKNRLKTKLNSENDTMLKCEQNLVNKSSECSPDVKDSDQISPDDNYNINLLTPPKSVEEADDWNENIVDAAQRSLSLLSSMLNPSQPGSPLMSSEKQEEEAEACVDQDSENENGSAECCTIEEMYFNPCPDGQLLTLGQLLSLDSEKSSVSEIEQENKDNCEGRSLIAGKESLCEKSPDVKDSDDLKNEKPTVESIKSGWTLDNVGLITIGELYLMLGQPSKIVLEYEFEQPREKDKASVINDDEGKCDPQSFSSQELAEIMKKLMQAAATAFTEFKNKQTPLSPTSRNSAHTRLNTTVQLNKSNSRCIHKNPPNVKPAMKAKSCSANIKDPSVSSSVIDICGRKDAKLSTSSTEMCSTTNSLSTVCSDGMPSLSEKHVFVVPVGTAPRTVKKPIQESLKEEIDKLLPGTRRGCRVRRKPLVVQRPLLPREGIVAGPRPMTLVHLVPSGSQLAAVIPSTCAATESKAMLPANKVVKILSTGPAIDVRPIQVPLIKPVSGDANQNVILQSTTIPATHLMVAPGTSQSIQAIDHQNIALSSSVNSLQNVCTLINSIDKSPIVIASPADAEPALPNIASLSSSAHNHNTVALSTSERVTGIHDKMISSSSSSPPQISIPEPPCSSSSSLSPDSVSSFIEISLTRDLASKAISERSNSNLLDFSRNSTLSAFGLPSSKTSPSDDISQALNPEIASSENTPPQSPPSRPFRINSPGPEAQWLNGESGELSLNTFLNTLESPCKVLSVPSSMNAGSENSNLDPITRLAPVVDSQVRCLLEECSVDFITKFEDLADVINSSNNDSKQA